MKARALKTHRVTVGESLLSLVDEFVPPLLEKSILVITSKIVSLCEGRVIPKSQASKVDLIQEEADAILETEHPIQDFYLTIKNHLLIPSAGIDESNGEDVYILYPKEVQSTCEAVWSHLRSTRGLKEVGVIITDSHTTPLRRGVTGIALGFCGFKPLYSYIGKPDLYGHPLRVTQMNLLDALATTGVFVMGEGDEQTPFALIEEAPKMVFLNHPPTEEEENSVVISPEEDLYGALFQNASWQWRNQ